MNRWKVERIRYRSWITGEVILGEGWWVIAPDGYVVHAEYTWHAAMRYADTQARTITVTLPRTGEVTTIPTPPGKDGPVELTCETVNFYSIAGRKGLVGIFQQELQPLALALLAYHYRQEGA